MKKALRIVALLVAVFMLAAVVAACGEDTKDETTTAATTTTKAAETTAAATTAASGDDTPTPGDDDDDDDDDDDEPETPVTGDDADAFHGQFKVIAVDTESLEVVGLNPWGDGAATQLFDGADGFFNADDAETKMGGGVSNFDVMLTFKIEKAKLVAYAFVSGNDSGQYTGRTPTSWVIRGSNDGENWKDLDVVKNSGMEDENHQYFGFEIDAANQAEYEWIQIEFDGSSTADSELLESIQLNECYLYTK